MKPIKVDQATATPQQIAAATKNARAQRQQRAVGYFLDQGFAMPKAVELAALYAASIAYGKKHGRRSTQQVMSDQAAQRGTSTAPESPIWTSPKGCLPHERVAARLAHFARMSSETAHQIAASTARTAEAKRG